MSKLFRTVYLSRTFLVPNRCCWFSIKNLVNKMGMSPSAPANGRDGQPASSIFDFDVENAESSTVSMTSFQGQKVYYVVNVATN